MLNYRHTSAVNAVCHAHTVVRKNTTVKFWFAFSTRITIFYTMSPKCVDLDCWTPLTSTKKVKGKVWYLL